MMTVQFGLSIVVTACSVTLHHGLLIVFYAAGVSPLQGFDIGLNWAAEVLRFFLPFYGVLSYLTAPCIVRAGPMHNGPLRINNPSEMKIC
jgi:hypothetical protein